MRTMLALVILLQACTTAQANDQLEDCNQKAAGISGEERSTVIANCIRRSASVTNLPPRFARMAECNREAGDMKGEDRVKFVNDCMDRP